MYAFETSPCWLTETLLAGSHAVEITNLALSVMDRIIALSPSGPLVASVVAVRA